MRTFTLIVAVLLPLLGNASDMPLEPFSESPPFQLFTGYVAIDTDLDGLPDNYEIANGLNAFISDSSQDHDQDGFTNLDEYNAGTDPSVFTANVNGSSISSNFSLNTKTTVQDNDSDGLPDWWENLFGLPNGKDGPSDDPDNDRITNFDEYQQDLNPIQIENHSLSVATSSLFIVVTSGSFPRLGLDTDADGIPDWWELKYGFLADTFDSDKDDDGDGLDNLNEFLRGGDPHRDDFQFESAVSSVNFTIQTRILRIDTDRDGIPDTWEQSSGTDPLTSDALNDPDLDGISNIQEYAAGTNPLVSDDASKTRSISEYFGVDTGGLQISYWQESDFDGMPDWWELRYGFNIHFNDSGGNQDNDLFTNIQEFKFGTNPIVYDSQRPQDIYSANFLVNTGGQLSDSDSDGLPDAWELNFFGTLSISGAADSDLDGLTNGQEYASGTNPLDSTSSLKGLVRQEGELVSITWRTVPGKTYTVFRISLENLNQRESLFEQTASGEALAFEFRNDNEEGFFVIRVQ